MLKYVFTSTQLVFGMFTVLPSKTLDGGSVVLGLT